MKKFLFILLTALSFGTLYGQEAMPADLTGGLSGYVPETSLYSSGFSLFKKREKPAYKKTVYWKRHITQNVLGAFSLLVGAGLLYPSIGVTALTGEENKLVTTGIVFGGLFTLASIPLFISAHHNKVKAHRVSLGADYIVTPSIGGGSRKDMQPALGISISF